MRVLGRGERAIARLAALQHGVIAREQLLAAGIGRGAIAHRLENGRLHRFHPGIYVVGRPSREPLAEEMAAVLLLKGHGILSRRSAAAVCGLAERPASVTLTVVGRDRRSRPGLIIHRSTTLTRRDVRIWQGLPVTAPARTLIDLAADATDHELLRALAQARFRRIVTEAEIDAALSAKPTRKGAARLRALTQADDSGSESGNERRMFALLTAAGLPLPVAQVRLNGYRVDFLWPAQRLVVEVDSYDFHGDRAAFESDRERDQVLIVAGYRVIRITARQLRDQPFAVIARLAGALTQAA